MSAKTGIEWTDATWNPVRGCSRVSEGCRNCYAEAVAARFSGPGLPYAGLAMSTAGGPRWTGHVRLIEKHLADPLRWKEPRRIFVNSMSDLFHEKLADAEIDRVFAVMSVARRHTFQILTKRPERMKAYIARIERSHHGIAGPIPLPNVWLGVSVEDQLTADQRIPHLMRTPAAVRFISAEPLLGPIQIGVTSGDGSLDLYEYGSGGNTLDWVIVGGESGARARPMNHQWATYLRDQCVQGGVPFFFKQWGEWWPLADPCEASQYPHAPMTDDHRFVRLGKKRAGRLLDGLEWSEFPR